MVGCFRTVLVVGTMVMTTMSVCASDVVAARCHTTKDLEGLGAELGGGLQVVELNENQRDEHVTHQLLGDVSNERKKI